MASILKAIKPVLTDFVGEVQRSLGYFTNTHRDAHVAHMVGLGSAFKLPGLQKYLADKLSLEVKKPARFEKMGGEAVTTDPLFQENLLTFPVAYGLALQGLGLARLSTNLLPHGIRTDRIVRSKKPYAAAAAACLLVGLGGMAAGFSAPYSALKDKNIDQGIQMTKTAGTAYSAQQSKFDEELAKSKQKQDETKFIIAGQEERLNWPRFVEVFTASLPRPGADGNLTETNAKANSTTPPFNQEQVWKGEADAGVKAYEWFRDRMSKGVPIEEAIADARSDMPKSLAFVNIETVHTRWVNNANAFLQAADAQVKSRYNINIADWMTDEEREKDEALGGRWKPKAGDGGAWVIEIRGYTDHRGGRTFLNHSLLRNLQRFDQFAATGEKKVGQYIVGVPDPVGKDKDGKPRVSHPFLYSVFPPVADPQPGVFLYIGQSYLDGLLPTAAGGPGGEGGMQPGAVSIPGMPPPGGMPDGGTPAAPTAGLAPAWRGLGGTGGAAGTGTGTPSATVGMPLTPGTPGTPPRAVDANARRRHEFVVMFLWREPLPSTPGAAAAPPPPQ